MSNPPVCFKSLAGIKKAAKKLPKGNGLTYFDKLNAVAQQAGFSNYNHAVNHFQHVTPSSPWVSVKCEFHWKKPTAHFPELVGHLRVSVTPREGLSSDALQKLVFVIPEFWTTFGSQQHPHEHFRIDSAYFNRVTTMQHIARSERTKRGVLSFHLLNNVWMASIFDYGTTRSRSEMESEIARDVSDHITRTVNLYQENQLADSRILSDETHRHMVSLWIPDQLEKMLEWHSTLTM